MKFTPVSSFTLLFALGIWACSPASQATGGEQPAPLDADGDGIADALGRPLDLNNDGMFDMHDINNDGIDDGIGIDQNGDGSFDGIAIDADGDGIFESLDTSGDGKPDTTVVPERGTGGTDGGTTPTEGTGGGSVVGTGGGNAQPSGPLTMGYVYNLNEFGGNAGLDLLPYQNIDYVVHAFITSDNAGLGTVQELEYFGPLRSAGLVEKVHAAGKKVVLSLGGAGSTWQMAEVIKKGNQQTFANNVAAKIAEWGYDGVDFDFEFPGNNCTPAEFTELLTLLRDAVRAQNPDALVMFGISPGWWLQSYEWAKLGAVADYGFYFCYDWNMPQKGPMTSSATFNMQGGGQIEQSCRGAMNYMIEQGFPAEKIIVGVGFSANGGLPYHSAPAAVVSAPVDPVSMEANAGGGWWLNPAAAIMKTNAVLDPTQSVLTGGATAAGMGWWHWGEENLTSGADLSSAIRARVDEL